MKTSYKFALTLVVSVMAIAFSAFTNAKPSKDKDVADAWFKLKSGVSPTAANARIASNYDLVSSEPCPGSETYCGVQAENLAGQPVLTSGTAARTQIDAFFSSSPVVGSRISAQD